MMNITIKKAIKVRYLCTLSNVHTSKRLGVKLPILSDELVHTFLMIRKVGQGLLNASTMRATAARLRQLSFSEGQISKTNI